MVIFLIHLILLAIIVYSFYTLNTRCAKLEAENRIFRWFFKHQSCVETKYLDASEAMLRAAYEHAEQAQTPQSSRH